MPYQVLEGTEVRPLDFSGVSLANSIRNRAIEDARGMYQLALMGIQAGLPIDQAAQFQQIGNDILLRYFGLTPDMLISPQTSYDYVPKEFASAKPDDAIKMLNFANSIHNNQNPSLTDILDPNYTPPSTPQPTISKLSPIQEAMVTQTGPSLLDNPLVFNDINYEPSPTQTQPQSYLTPLDLALLGQTGPSLLNNPYVFPGFQPQTPTSNIAIPGTPTSVDTSPIPKPPAPSNSSRTNQSVLTADEEKKLEDRIRAYVPKLKQVGIPDDEIEKWIDFIKGSYVQLFKKSGFDVIRNTLPRDVDNFIRQYQYEHQGVK